MLSFRATLARTVLITSLALGLVASPSASAQEAADEPALVADDLTPIEPPAPLATLVATAAPVPAAAAARIAATVIDNRFQPGALTVAVGSTVTWTNNGNNMHTLTSTDGLFDSGGLLGGQAFNFTFDKAGTYRLLCRQHGLNGMFGQVVVE